MTNKYVTSMAMHRQKLCIGLLYVVHFYMKVLTFLYKLQHSTQ